MFIALIVKKSIMTEEPTTNEPPKDATENNPDENLPESKPDGSISDFHRILLDLCLDRTKNEVEKANNINIRVASWAGIISIVCAALFYQTTLKFFDIPDLPTRCTVYITFYYIFLAIAWASFFASVFCFFRTELVTFVSSVATMKVWLSWRETNKHVPDIATQFVDAISERLAESEEDFNKVCERKFTFLKLAQIFLAITLSSLVVLSVFKGVAELILKF